MLDDEDTNFLVLIANPNTLIGFVIWIAVILTVAIIVANNKDDCSKELCNVGLPRLIDGECICVDLPKPKNGEIR